MRKFFQDPKKILVNRETGMVVAFFIAFSGGTNDSALAGFLDVPVDPNPQTISCPDGTDCGELRIEDYYAWQSPGGVFSPRDPSDPRLRTPGADRGGARMQAFFTLTNPSQTRNYRWVQAVVGGTSTIGTPPYIDPFNKDDTLPFYWTNVELPDFTTDKYNIEILDIPSQPLTNATPGNPASVEFETTLVCWWDQQMHLFQSFTWGYSITAQAGGLFNVQVDPFAWTAPSNTMRNLIVQFDGDEDGTPDGWQISEECCPTLKDFGDAPDSYRTLLASDGPRYNEGHLQRLGAQWDSEIDGQPTVLADGDDRILLGGYPNPLDDEDGVIFGDSWVDVIFNITRPDPNPYQLRAWWDTNYNGMFDHTSELYIDDLLTLGPGIFTKRYNLGFNPKADDLYSRFRLTWDPLDLDVKPFGEYYSKADCNPTDAAAGNCASHGEVEDYVHVPEPSSTLSLLTFGILGAGSAVTQKLLKRR